MQADGQGQPNTQVPSRQVQVQVRAQVLARVRAQVQGQEQVGKNTLEEHKLNGTDEEQPMRERREREGESGGTGTERESERDRDEGEGEERGEMSGETRERARASASQSWASGASTASGASGASLNASGHKVTDNDACGLQGGNARDSSRMRARTVARGPWTLRFSAREGGWLEGHEDLET
jgi:hypothetical protein